MKTEENKFRFDKLKIDSLCTVSKTISRNANSNIILFKNAKETSISKEGYDYAKTFIVFSGHIEIKNFNHSYDLNKYDMVMLEDKSMINTYMFSDSVYFEINLQGDIGMKGLIENKVYNLKDLIDYESGSVKNFDIMSNANTMMCIMALDEGEELSEHRAPGDAIITILDGEMILGYEGNEYNLKEGDSFSFKKNGRHYLKATKKFKMLLILEKNSD